VDKTFIFIFHYQAWGKDFPLCHHFQTGYQAYLASHPVGDRGFFTGGKVNRM